MEEPAQVQTEEEAPADESNGDFGYYIAAYPYDSTEPGDLSFQAGEMVIVTKKEGDWWTGTIGDRTGMFPCNYVTKTEVGQQMTPASATTTAGDEQSFDYSFQKVGGQSFSLCHFHVNCCVSNQTNQCFLITLNILWCVFVLGQP